MMLGHYLRHRYIGDAPLLSKAVCNFLGESIFSLLVLKIFIRLPRVFLLLKVALESDLAPSLSNSITTHKRQFWNCTVWNSLTFGVLDSSEKSFRYLDHTDKLASFKEDQRPNRCNAAIWRLFLYK